MHALRAEEVGGHPRGLRLSRRPKPAAQNTETGFALELAARKEPCCLAVMYHYVHDFEPITCRGVRGLTSKEFGIQLDHLCSVMEPISWPDLFAWTQGRSGLPDRCFLLTFDDGLADHAKIVLPILEERGLRGTFFVSGSILTDRRLLPAHTIHLLLSYLGEQQLLDRVTAYLSDHAGDTDWIASMDQDAAESMYHYETPIRARLKYLLTIVLPRDVRNAAIDYLFERHVGSTMHWAQAWYLGWDDIARMQELGHTIGGHGHCHEPYVRLTPSEQLRDMFAVAAVLRDGLGSGIRPFSYPYGCAGNETRAACAQAGFAHAFTTQSRCIEFGSDPFQLPRIDTNHVDATLQQEYPCTQVP